MTNSFVYYVTGAVNGISTPWGFGLYVNVIVRGQRLPGVYPHVMLTPRPCFQRSPRPLKLFRARVNREGLGSEATTEVAVSNSAHAQNVSAYITLFAGAP